MMQIDLVYIWYDGKSFIDSGEKKMLNELWPNKATCFDFKNKIDIFSTAKMTKYVWVRLLLINLHFYVCTACKVDRSPSDYYHTAIFVSCSPPPQSLFMWNMHIMARHISIYSDYRRHAHNISRHRICIGIWRFASRPILKYFECT